MIRIAIMTVLIAVVVCRAQTTPPALLHQVDLRDPPALLLTLVHGETRDVCVRFRNYGSMIDMSGYTVMLHGQTNGQSGSSYQTAGGPGLPGDALAATSGWVYVRVDVSSWMPPAPAPLTWTLKAESTNGWSILRAGGPLTLLGTAAVDLASPVPVSILDAARAEMVSSGHQWRAEWQAGDAAGSNYADYAAATTGAQLRAYADAAAAAARTNAGLDAAAALAAAAPSLSVAEAQRIVQADTNAWLVLSGGAGVLYQVSASSEIVDGTNAVVITYADIDESEWVAPQVDDVWTWSDGKYVRIYGAGEEWWLQPYEGSWIVRDAEGVFCAAPGGGPTGVLYVAADRWRLRFGYTGTVTNTVVVTNAYPLATDAGTVIRISEHSADPGAHPDRPTFQAVTNLVAAYSIPTNVVAGWKVWDSGSNRFWTVSATNLRFYVWE